MVNHIINVSSDELVIGEQIRQLRLRSNITQAELARRANVDRTTVGRIEAGEGGSISSLVRIVRALDGAEWLASLAAPVPSVSPMQQLRQRQRTELEQRRRASPTRSSP